MSPQRAVGEEIGPPTAFWSGFETFHIVSWHVGANGEKLKFSVFGRLGDPVGTGQYLGSGYRTGHMGLVRISDVATGSR